MKNLLIAAGFALTTISTSVMAHNTNEFNNNNCNITLENDLLINSQQVSLNDAGTELWRISNDGKLWIDGKTVQVDRQTTALLQQYQAGIRSQTLETLELVEDALVLAADAVNTVLTELTGKPLEKHPAMQTALDNIRTASERIVVRDGDNIAVHGSRMQNMDDAFGAEFEQAIEQAVTQSMGSVLMLVGQAISSGEGNFEQRMEAFGKKMERFGEDLEARIEAKADGLEHRGELMCSNIKQLNQLESDIQQAVPAMQKYDLIQVSDNKSDKTAFYLFN